MKFQFMTLLVVAISPLMSSSVAADPAVIGKSITEKMPNTEVRSVTQSSIAGLWEVVVNGSNVFYTDAKGETGFFGKLVDLRTRTDLTQARTQELLVLDFSSLPVDKAIVKTKGNGARKLAVFSDPDCPYCKQLEKELEGITDVTVYTYLLPLTSIHPDAMRKAEIIWCSPDREKAYREWMVNGTAPTGGRDCPTPIADIVALAKSRWIQGTPGMVFASGKLVPGALQRHQIEALLDSPRATTGTTQ